MFTYNFKRLLNLIGIVLFKKLIIAIKNNNLSQIREEIEAYILLSKLYMTYFLERKLSVKLPYLGLSSQSPCFVISKVFFG